MEGNNSKNLKIIYLIIIVIIILIGIFGIYLVSRQNSNENIENNQGTNQGDNQEPEDKTDTWTNDYIPENIKMDDTLDNGAFYNIAVDELKAVIKNILSQNGINEYQETSDETIYSVSENSMNFNLQASLENGKIINIAYWYGKSETNNVNPKDICDKIFMNLFEEKYAQEFIKIGEELSVPGSKYSNYTLYVKMSYNNILLESLDEETRSEIEPLIKDNDMDMIFCTPMKEEKYIEYSSNV